MHANRLVMLCVFFSLNVKSAIANGPIAWLCLFFALSLSLFARVLCVVSCIVSRSVVSPFACSLSSKRLCCYSVHLVVRVHFASIVLYLENNYFANCGRWVREYVYWGLRIIHNYPMRCMFFLIFKYMCFLSSFAWTFWDEIIHWEYCRLAALKTCHFNGNDLIIDFGF